MTEIKGSSVPVNPAKPEEYRKLATEFENFEGEQVRIEVRFKKPSMSACERAMKEAVKDAARAMRNLTVACAHPDDKQSLLEAMEEYPGVPLGFGNELLERSGFMAGVDALGKR